MEDISTLLLVYRSETGDEFTQPASELVEVGTLIDPESGDDMELVGWRRTPVQLTRQDPSQTIEVQTPAGVLSIALGVAPDGATVVFLDTPEWEPTANLLRVNVNDGPVFNYADAVNSYGDVS